MIVINFIGTKINKFQCNGIAKSFLKSVLGSAFERWQKTALLFFLSVGFLWLEKMNVLFVRLAFLVQKLMFSTFFRIMHNGLVYET